MERLLLRPHEAAELLGLGRSTVYELIASGAIPSITIGKSRRVPLEALRAWVRAQTDTSAMVRSVPVSPSAVGDERPTNAG
jgi:excisionase family DNA binding protein